MLKLALFALIAVTTGTSQAQSLPQIVEGTWTFHYPNNFEFQLTMARTSSATFTAAYAGNVIGNGRMTATSGSINFTLSWLYVSSNIPGSGMQYFGVLSSDGTKMTGTYGVSVSQSSGSWSASLSAPVAPPTTPPVTPQPTTGTACDQRLLSGTYSFLVSGSVQTDAGAVSVGIIGRVTSDANGGLVGGQYVSIDGQLQKRFLTGSYTVAGDCMVAITATDDLGDKATFVGALSSGGKTLQLLRADAGTKVTGTAYQQ